jgi:ADP-heptose:LPS heptosyltransferase
VRVAITGVPGEEHLTARVAAAMRAPAADLCGRTDLGVLAALLRDAAGLMTNDTGVAHLCAAVGTPSVVVFLSGDPRRWSHAGRGPHRVVRVRVECSPCPHLACPIDHRCAARLPARAVIREALAMLAGAWRST